MDTINGQVSFLIFKDFGGFSDSAIVYFSLDLAVNRMSPNPEIGTETSDSSSKMKEESLSSCLLAALEKWG